jgi:hypothetical protein
MSMTTSRWRFPAALLLLLTLSGCDGSSPTSPSIRELSGLWQGRVSLRGEVTSSDALQVELTLIEEASSVRGEMVDSTGGRWTISGSRSVLEATHQPSTSACALVTLVVENSRSSGGITSELTGTTSGRCGGTVIGNFRLSRR